MIICSKGCSYLLGLKAEHFGSPDQLCAQDSAHGSGYIVSGSFLGGADNEGFRRHSFFLSVVFCFLVT